MTIAITLPTPLDHPVDWIPPSRYLVPVVDGLTAYWVRFRQPVGGPLHIDYMPHDRWELAPNHIKLAAVERLLCSPIWARQMHGRILSDCGGCGRYLQPGRERGFGAHEECVADRKQIADATRTERQRARDHLLDALLPTWEAADQDRRARALVSAGPIVIAKIDGAAARAEQGLPAKGMPLPDHSIRDRSHPAVPALADRLATRITALDPAGQREAWTWVDLDTTRHLIADLASPQPATRLTAPVRTPTYAEPLLAQAAHAGRILYAHITPQPALYLMATVVLP